MTNSGLAESATLLASVAQAIWPLVRRLYRERQAGLMPLAADNELLERGLDETLARLLRGTVDDSWWRELLNRIGHPVVTPEFLRAAAQRDVDLARSIAAKVLARAPETCSHEEAIAILQVVLIAGAAFEAQHAWAGWLEEQLAGIAAGLPAGEASKAFLDHLTELKKILPLTFSIQSRAEALASAAS